MSRGQPGASRRGAEFAEWLVATLIMLIATFAILQAVGGEVGGFVQGVIDAVRRVLGL